MDLEHLSYSSITSYLYCARNWRFKYLDKQPTFSTPELALFQYPLIGSKG